MSFRQLMKKKGDLPSKICRSCGKPFSWRKKWQRDWEQVKYCSERCRRSRSRCQGEVDFS